MVVSITWSSASGGGSPYSEPVSHSTIGNGETGTPKSLYISHDGSNKITNCAFYIQAYTGSYDGDATASDDYNELIAWGDTDNGFQMEQDGAADTYGDIFKTGTGDNSTNAIQLSTDSGVGTAGEIGSSEEAFVKVRIDVPSGEDVAGKRQFDQVLKYTYTS